MAPTSADLVQRNQAYAATHHALPFIEEIEATGATPPKTCVVTCCDPRVVPERLLGLNIGEVFVFRTIGGHPQAVFKDVVTLDIVSQGFEDLVVMYHTDCGITHFKDSMIRTKLSQAHPDVEPSIREMSFGAIEMTLEDSLRDDIKWLKEQSLLREGLGPRIKGFVYDIKSGLLNEVE